MKIEVKNIVFKSIPRDAITSPYEGRVFIEGKHAANCEKDGITGKLSIDPVDEYGRKLLHWTATALQEPYRDLPARRKGKQLNMPTIEGTIERLVQEHITRPAVKVTNLGTERYQRTHLVYGKPGSSVFSLLLPSPPLFRLLENPLLFNELARIIRERIVAELRPGEQLLNTNIPQSVWQLAGLKAPQYAPVEKNGKPIGKGLSP
ncbi:hypothetical protein [Olivibacter jilunii]|uniref:hypothetical protein n=1 Tax=Olivibacter jilunii TaxID=985016 RepID=UPI0010317350|nr:hypothetical protein [Olivibacter jilunii]